MLLTASAVAQVVPLTQRSWSPQTIDTDRIVAADLDADFRDDAVLVTAAGQLIRGVNPGSAKGFFALTGVSDVHDAVAVRRDVGGDLIVSVDPTQGLCVTGLRPNGSSLTVPSRPTLWTDVVRLRVGHFGGVVLAGITADGSTVRLAGFDPTTLGFTSLGSVPFTDPVLDLGFAKRDQDTRPHLAALTATALVRRDLNGATLSSVGSTAPEGSIVTMPGGRDVAWVRRQDEELPWELVLERDGSTSAPVALVFANPAMDDLTVVDIDVGYLDADPLPDLVIGQSAVGALAVLFGTPAGYSPSFSSVVDLQDLHSPSTTIPPAPIVARVDGSLLDGLFCIQPGNPALDVVYEVPLPNHQLRGGDWVIDVTVEPEYTPGSIGELDVELTIPTSLRSWAEQNQLDSVQITVWAGTGIVDSAGNYEPQTAEIAPQIVSDSYWMLRGFQFEDHVVSVPIDIGPRAATVDWDGMHLLLMVRLARISTGPHPEVQNASFTVPFWAAMDLPAPSGFFTSPVTEGSVFDPGDPVREVTTGNNKNIGRYRRARPVFPGLQGPPSGSPLVGRGTTAPPQ